MEPEGKTAPETEDDPWRTEVRVFLVGGESGPVSIQEVVLGANPATEVNLACLTIRTEDALVAPTSQFFGEVARAYGLDSQTATRIGQLAEAACRHVIGTAFDPGEDGEFDIALIRRPGQVVLAVEDRGLPTSPENLQPARSPQTPLHQTDDRNQFPWLQELAHAVVFRNLGRNGKRIEYIRHLPSPELAQETPAAAAEPPKAEDPVSLRLLLPDDAVALSRLIYRAYGYTYGSEFVYYPDRVVAMLQSGCMESCVAENSQGEIVGHVAMLLHKPNARSGETAMAVVDPRYRGRKLFELMKTFMSDHARSRGMFGLYSEAVAVHTFTQRGNLALGGFETGYLLGFTPNTQVFRKIREDKPQNRQTAVLFYVRTNDEPERVLHVPSHHLDIIDTIYERGGLNRVVLPAPADLTLHAIPEPLTQLTVNARADVGRAFLHVQHYGLDILRRIRDLLRDLRAQGFACIYLDLPLADSITAVLCKAFESFGFSFAGLILELDEGDILRLQYLNGITIDPDEIQVASDFGRKLLNYTLMARTTMLQLHEAA